MVMDVHLAESWSLHSSILQLLPPVVRQPDVLRQYLTAVLSFVLHWQEKDTAWFILPNEIQAARISEEVWNTLVEIHSHFSMVEVFALAMFMVSLCYHPHAINTTIRDHIPNPPKVNYAVDCSETELLSIEQVQSSFK